MAQLLDEKLLDLQYPIGKFAFPGTLSAKERAFAIDTLARLPQQLAEALEGLSESQLGAAYRPAGWSLRQLVHHIADSHVTAYSWMRLALTEDWPTVYDYDPAALAELADSALPPAVSIALLEGLHCRWVVTLEGVAEDDWAGRGYVHPQSGRCSLERALEMYGWHSRHHLAHIVNFRKRNVKSP
jgi:hypothetical protein